MKKLEAAMGRPSKTCLTMVAGSIERSPLLSHLMEDFLMRAPAVLEKGPLVRKHLKFLKDMTLDLKALPGLLTICHDLPSLMAALKEGTCSELQKAFRDKLTDIMGFAMTESDLDPEEAKQIAKLMTDACMTYPQDGDLQAYVCAAGSWVQTSCQKKAVKDVMQSIAEVDAMSPEQQEKYLAAVTALSAKLSATTINEKLIEPVQVDMMTRLATNLWQLIAISWEKDNPIPVKLEFVGQCASVLAGYTQDAELKLAAEVVLACFSVTHAFTDLQRMNDANENHNVLMQKTLSLQRKLNRLQKSLEGTTEKELAAKFGVLKLVDDFQATSAGMS